MDYSDEKSCFIIAEVGVNHNGSVEVAKKLVDSSKAAGADAVKFQSYKTHLLASHNTPKVGYQESADAKDESHFEMLQKLELSEKAQADLKEYCERAGIIFMSTPYDIQSAKFLNEGLDVKIFKTASADIVDHVLQEYIAQSRKQSIISIGMAEMEEIKQVISIYEKEGNRNISLLQCTSSYPCADGDLDLSCIPVLAKWAGIPVGFSDHSQGSVASMIAYGLGARIIEKHVTLDRRMDGPDHSASAEVEEFRELVTNIRRAERMLGRNYKKCSESELQMRAVSRKSAHARRALEVGDLLSENDILLKRPGTGVIGNQLDRLIGKRVRTCLNEGDLITWEHIDE